MSCQSEESLLFHPWQCWQILCALDEGRFQKRTFIFKVPQATSGKCIADCPFRAGEDISLPLAQLCNLPQVICKWNEEVQPKNPVLASAFTIVLQSHRSIWCPLFCWPFQQVSTKDNTKLFLRTLRNNLLQGRCRRKEAARRQWLLDQVNPRDVANQAQARWVSPSDSRAG